MPRLLFEKTGNAVWISHLDLMRLFQRAFKRAGLPLTHTHGFNPRPSVSIALPLSVGVESHCELLDFALDGEDVPCDKILERLNENLVPGVRVLDVYENGGKIKNIAYLSCAVFLEYGDKVPADAGDGIAELLKQPEVLMEKKGKNGPTVQNITPMIRSVAVIPLDEHTLELRALICCQNPSLNPMLIGGAVEKYLPHWKPDFIRYARLEIFDSEETIFR